MAKDESLRISKTDGIAPGWARMVEIGGRQIAPFNVHGRFYVIDNACTHRGGPPRAEGMGGGTKVICPWHGTVFDVTSGAGWRAPTPCEAAHYDVRVVSRFEIRL